MHYSSWKNYRLSRLMVGTAQFGMPYGVANRAGQPDYRHVLAIVAAALEGGVNCFDTAASYGTSEELLGRAIHELKVADQVVVVTKIRPLSPAEQADSALASQAIVESVGESRRRLRLDCLPVVLFHREAEAVYRHALEGLVANGWAGHVGVSCEQWPSAAVRFVDGGIAAALQVPASVLDRRHQRSGVFQKAVGSGVALFIRSVYLQGLLLMPEADIPASLREVLPARRKLELIAADAGISLAELALRFMLAQHGVTCVLTGVETVDQIAENAAIVGRGPLPEDVLTRIRLLEPDLSDALLMPVTWERK